MPEVTVREVKTFGNLGLKGQCHEIFCFWFFFMNQFPPSPRVSHEGRFKVFWKFAEIFTSQGAPPVSMTSAANLPPVSMTQAANFATSFASVVDSGGKFVTGLNDTGGKFAAGVSDTSGNLPSVLMTLAATISDCWDLKENLKGKMYL